MALQSAGILLFRDRSGSREFFLVHPGGPFWKNKDNGAWSIPKGEYDFGDDPLAAAIREFYEETGNQIEGNFIPLTPVRLKSGKKIQAFACQFEKELTPIKSNTFEIEWPPRSGKQQAFPEVDKGEWFSIDIAKDKINPGQIPFLDQSGFLF